MQKSTIYRKPMGENLATCRIEHIFGFVEGAMNGSLVRSIGMMRAKAANALTNLVYNIFYKKRKKEASSIGGSEKKV